MTHPSPTSQRLAAGLAARIIHDISGPATGIMTGMDLYGDPESQDLRDSALELTASSAHTLLDLLGFYRAAFGASGGPQADERLKQLAATQFTGRRARLEWTSSIGSLSGQASQALLIMTQIVGDALAAGGVVRVATSLRGSTLVLSVAGEGARAQVQPEVLDGLAGREMNEGLAGRWAPALFLHSLIEGGAGSLTVAVPEGGLLLEVALPGSS